MGRGVASRTVRPRRTVGDACGVCRARGCAALGRWAEGRGCNPAQVLPTTTNPAGDLTYGSVVATILPTGKRRPLARVESKEGIYGEH